MVDRKRGTNLAARRKYPWEKWFGQHRTVIYRGRDYHCSQSIMWQQVRNAARAYGVRARVQDKNDHIIIEIASEIIYTDRNSAANEPESTPAIDEQTEKEGNQLMSEWSGDTPFSCSSY